MGLILWYGVVLGKAGNEVFSDVFCRGRMRINVVRKNSLDFLGMMFPLEDLLF